MRTLLRENIDGFILANVRTSFLNLLTGEFKTKEKLLFSFSILFLLFRLDYFSLFNSLNSLYYNNLSSDHRMDSLTTNNWLFIFLNLTSSTKDTKHKHLTASKGREVKNLIRLKIWFMYSGLGLSRWFSGKESTASAGDAGLILGLGRVPEGGNGNPLQHTCLENCMDVPGKSHRQKPEGYSPCSHGQLDTTKATEQACTRWLKKRM